MFRYQLARLIVEETGTPIRQKKDIASLVRPLAARCLPGTAAAGVDAGRLDLQSVVEQLA